MNILKAAERISKNHLGDVSTFTLKFIRDNDSIKVYIDDVPWKTGNASFLDNYSDWTLSMIRWSATGTSKIKNVKIKSL